MKPKHSCLILLAVGTLLAASSAHAALTWDTGQGVDNSITSGSGTWDLTATNWNAINGLGNIAWTNGNDAIFNGGGTITIGASAVSAGVITVNGTVETTWQGALNNLSFTTVNIGTTGGGKLSIKANTASPGNTVTGGTINIANGATLYVATNGQTPSVGSTINVQGTGSTDNRGAIRLDGTPTTAVSTLTGSVNLWGNTTIGGSAGALSGIISDGGSGFGISTATVGTGTLTFSGNNTYSGGMTIGAGTIQAGHNNAFGSGTLTQNAGTLSSNSTTARTLGNAYVIGGNVTLGNSTNTGTLTFSNTVALGGATRSITANSAVTFNGVISNGGITRAGTGDLTLGAANTYAGGTTLSAGRTNLNNAAGFGTGAVTISSGAQAYLVGSAVTVANAFTVSGTGTDGRGAIRINLATISGAVTLAGNTRFSGAGVEAGTISGNIGESAVGSVLEIGDTTASTNFLVSLTLSGTNTYTGGTLISGGKSISTATAGSAGAFGGGTITLNGGFLNTGGQTLANGISVATAPTTGGIKFGANATLTGAITGASGATLNIAATSASSLYLNGDTSGFNGTMAIDNTNGNVTASKSDGTASANIGGTSTTYEVNNGGTYGFSINRGTFNMGALSGNGKISASFNAASPSTVSIGALNNSTTFSGMLADNGTGVLAMTKVGTGTLTLSGTNTYTGITSIDAGALFINGDQTAATGDVSVTGTLAGSGGIIGGKTTVGSGGHLAVGNGTAGSVGTQTFTKDLTFSSGSIFDWDLTAADQTTGFDKVIGATGKTFDAAGSTFRVITDLVFTNDPTFWETAKSWSVFTGFTDLTGWAANTAVLVYGTNGQERTNLGVEGSFTVTGGTLSWNFSAVPEPSSALAGLLLGAGLLRRRRKN